MDEVKIYSLGLVHASACAPAAMERAGVEQAVNAVHPTGIDSDWAVSGDRQFRDGTPNPGPCDTEPEARRHWLLVC